jgi:hypothetical protein
MIGFFILILAFSGTIAWLWVGGIDYMQKFHPNYKGEDYLNWDIDEQDKEQIL